MVALLQTNLQTNELADFDELEQIGLAKSFELCFELLWNLLKDYLEYENIEIGVLSPNNILKAAANKGVFEAADLNGDVLAKAHKCRNELVHVYIKDKFLSALQNVKEMFLPELIKVDVYFRKLANGDSNE